MLKKISLPNSLSLRQLTGLRLILISLLAALLVFLHLNHTQFLWPAWGAIGGYALLLITTLIIPEITARKTIGLQLLLETQLLAVYLFVTGGASNPIISYYLVLIVFAAYHSEQKIVWLIALLSTINYAVLTRYNLPLNFHHHDMSLSSNDFFNLHIAGMWLIFLLSAGALAALLPPLVREKIQQQRELALLREQQLKNEQLIGLATLAAGTAHEMGTPLMTMELILNDAEELGLDKEDIKLLTQQVEICRTSLRKLAEAGRASQQSSHSIDSKEWLSLLLDRWTLSHPKARWHCDLETLDNAIITASPLLDQALLNLLDNAAQAGKQEVVISTEVDHKNWKIIIHQPDPNAYQALQDYKLLASQKDEGLGLGLYLSNASVEQFGGQIHLTATPENGSISILQLPLL